MTASEATLALGAAEAADVLLQYFAMVRCVAAGVSLADVAANLDRKALKVCVGVCGCVGVG